MGMCNTMKEQLAKGKKEDAAIQMIAILFQQIDDTETNTAHDASLRCYPGWAFSILSKAVHLDPHMPVCVLYELAKENMPQACEEYLEYVRTT